MSNMSHLPPSPSIKKSNAASVPASAASTATPKSPEGQESARCRSSLSPGTNLPSSEMKSSVMIAAVMTVIMPPPMVLE